MTDLHRDDARGQADQTTALRMTPAHARLLRRETLICVVINSLLPTAAIWAIGKTPPGTLIDGDHPIVVEMVSAAGIATFMLTLMLTLVIRARVRKGAVPMLGWRATDRAFLRVIPRNLLFRAAALGLAAVTLLVPAALLVVHLSDVLPLGDRQFALFNVIYGAVIGLVMGPIVILAALSDPN